MPISTAMVRRLPGLLALPILVASGCAANPAVETVATPSNYVYRCDDGLRFVARFPNPDRAILEAGAQTLTLPRAVSGSGARFVEGDVEFWVKGDEASLTDGGSAHSGCDALPTASRWDEAHALGADFFAMGQEPGWSLVIDEDAWLRFRGDYGATEVATAAPVRFAGMAGRVTWQARSDAGEIAVRARPEPCADSMSGEAFSHTVTFQLGDRTFEGCGRFPTPEP